MPPSRATYCSVIAMQFVSPSLIFASMRGTEVIGRSLTGIGDAPPIGAHKKGFGV